MLSQSIIRDDDGVGSLLHLFGHFQDTEGRRYMEYSNIYGAYNILVWFAKKYPELYINDDTKETVLHYAAAQVSVLAGSYQNH